MSKNEAGKIDGTVEAWEDGKLGLDAEYAEIAPEVSEGDLNEALDLQPISIRLEKSLVEDFKAFSRIYGIGYQPLMRQVLTRFAEGEKKLLFNQMQARAEREARELDAIEVVRFQPDDRKHVA